MMNTLTIEKTKTQTVADYLLLGEMNTPCQLINGEIIMSPSPRPLHQIVLSDLNDILKLYARKHGDLVLFAPMDLYIDNKNVFQPDLIYIKKRNRGIVTDRGVEGVPDIVVEVISPSNIFTDRNIKKKTYLKMGVGEFWIVDPANQTLEIYRSDQEDPETPSLYIIEKGKVTSATLPALKFNLKDIF